MDIVETAEHEIGIFERPSLKTSLSLVEEIKSLRAELQQLREQEPEFYYWRASGEDSTLYRGNYFGDDRFAPLYAAPVPAMPIPKQEPAGAVPENTAAIPMLNGKPEITNRMKAECMGDFTITIEHSCSACAYHGEQEDCEVCGGEIHYSQKHQAPWDTCKSIYKAMAAVAILPATPSPRITEQDSPK